MLDITHDIRPLTCQQLLDIAAHANADEGIRQGLIDLQRGRMRPAAEFFREFEAERGFFQ